MGWMCLRIEVVQGWDGRMGDEDYRMRPENGVGQTRDPKRSSLIGCPWWSPRNLLLSLM